MLDEMCRLYGKFASYLRRVLCKTRLIFPRINGALKFSCKNPFNFYLRILTLLLWLLIWPALALEGLLQWGLFLKQLSQGIYNFYSHLSKV